MEGGWGKSEMKISSLHFPTYNIKYNLKNSHSLMKNSRAHSAKLFCHGHEFSFFLFPTNPQNNLYLLVPHSVTWRTYTYISMNFTQSSKKSCNFSKSHNKVRSYTYGTNIMLMMMRIFNSHFWWFYLLWRFYLVLY
jgi:hypothetical protein